MLIYSTPPVFSARFEVLAEDNYDGPYQVCAGGGNSETNTSTCIASSAHTSVTFVRQRQVQRTRVPSPTRPHQSLVSWCPPTRRRTTLTRRRTPQPGLRTTSTR
jgi:hypothetical protein